MGDGMTVRYRAAAFDGNHRNRDQIRPHFVLEFPRDSKKARAEAIAKFTELLQNNRPVADLQLNAYGEYYAGATAYLEISDQHGSRTLAKYVGQVLERVEVGGFRNLSSASRGLWSMGARGCGDALPVWVEA